MLILSLQIANITMSNDTSSKTTPSTKIPQSNTHPRTFTDGGALPKLIVFDLDYTLWPFWSDTHLTPPLKAQPAGLTVKDRYGESFGFYSEVGGILAAIKEHGILIGIASRTSRPDLAGEMLDKLRIPVAGEEGQGKGKKARDFFDHEEIYPGSKVTHFKRLHKATGLDYAEMLFFDDESRNRDTESLGVTMQLVRDGVTKAEIERGVEAWRKRNKRS